jgi:small nuclear ribonucleoprotein (snRNP)-like protein
MLVELKNGETLNGHLVTCDTWMNLTLKEVVQTSPVCCPYLQQTSTDVPRKDGKDSYNSKFRMATNFSDYQRSMSKATMYVFVSRGRKGARGKEHG